MNMNYINIHLLLKIKMHTEELEIFNVDNPDHLGFIKNKIDQKFENELVKIINFSNINQSI